MHISRTRFVAIFLASAFLFQFVSNSVLGSEISLFPSNGDWYPGKESSIDWKSSLASIVYPVKYVLIEPLSFLAKDPDPAPPVLLLAFALYWAVIALVLHYVLSMIFKSKEA